MNWASPAERRSLGQSRRKQVGRQDQETFLPKERQTPPLKLMERSMHGRIPALVKVKYKLMAVSPFAYFRGAIPVMAADLAILPNTGIMVQLCGDAHVRNLGAYAGPDGRLIFDINDFDETSRGPFEWDLKRMVSSLVLAGRAAGNKDSFARQAGVKCVERYAAQMRAFSQMAGLEVARFQVHRIGEVTPIHDALAKAERATPLHILETLTTPGRGRSEASRHFREDQEPTLKRVTGRQAAEVLGALGSYRQTLEPQRQHLLSFYRPLDVAFKVVGTGSVGLRDYCVYFEGNGPADPLFLQMKEEIPSAYAAYLPEAHQVPHNGQRVVEGQRAMQVQSDPFLGWTQIGGRDYMVRQLNDHKGPIELDDLVGPSLEAFAEVSGELLARGHARSGDPMVLAGYIGTGSAFAEAIARFGVLYADQIETDWRTLKRTVKTSE